MRELPIIMKDALVVATEEGRKTQTSRRGGLEEVNAEPERWVFSHWMSVATSGNAEEKRPAALMLCHGGHALVKCRWAVGDRLYLKEMTAPEGIDQYGEVVRPAYRALGHTTPLRWVSGRYMKKTDARIWMRVTDVTVRRVQELTPEEMMNEGIEVKVSAHGRVLWPVSVQDGPLEFLPKGVNPSRTSLGVGVVFRAYWASLWSGINGRESWERNEWMWVVKYKLHREHEAEYRAWREAKTLEAV